MSKRKPKKQEEIDTGRWLLTYADLMNNLLVFFMLLYAMSIMDLQKFEALADQFRKMFNPDTVIEDYRDDIETEIKEDLVLPELPEEESAEPEPEEVEETFIDDKENEYDPFDALYQNIKSMLLERGYDEFVSIEKVNEFIYFRFNDGILFHPDSPEMKEDSFDILASVGQIIKDAGDLIALIDISGYTAKVNDDPDINILSWKLSVDRSLTVLQFLIKQCELPQSKMSIIGYAHYKPLGDDSTPEGRALNRRVEIKISRYLEELIDIEN